jgi:hypothetical protein
MYLRTVRLMINVNKFKNAVDAKDIILRQPRFSSNQCQALSLRAFRFLLRMQKELRRSFLRMLKEELILNQHLYTHMRALFLNGLDGIGLTHNINLSLNLLGGTYKFWHPY